MLKQPFEVPQHFFSDFGWGHFQGMDKNVFTSAVSESLQSPDVNETFPSLVRKKYKQPHGTPVDTEKLNIQHRLPTLDMSTWMSFSSGLT